MPEAHFDATAGGYDTEFTDTAVGRLQRAVTHRYLQQLIAQARPQTALELNCGTGADARWLAQQGLLVTATDLSAAMVQETTAKVVGLGVRVLQAGIQDIGRRLPHERYDLILSNFGGYNCLSPAEVRTSVAALHKLLRPGGHLVTVVMGRFCAWETLYFAAKLRPGAAVRRWGGGPVQARLADGVLQPTYYYGPRQWQRLFGERFTPVARMAVGAYLPPSYLDPFVAQRPRLLQRLSKWEDAAYGKHFPAAFSDHFLVAFRRK